MAQLTPDRILAALRFAPPEGFTSAELAVKLGVHPYRMSTALSRLAAYGAIDQTFHRRPDNPQRFCRWKHRDLTNAD